MRDPHDLTADLPAPRDDEPASLRRDIVDELRDHLDCALHRELHSRGCISADQPHHNAEHRVLTRFGNPATVARRLWWDAMKETIMSQRITAGMASLAAIACCAMFVLMWQTQAANRALVQESQALNARLLEQMQSLAEGLRPAGEGDKAPAEWNRLRLKCVADGEKGPPLAGVRVRLLSASENTRGIPPTELASGEDGVIDFGQVLYGQYMIDCTAPNGMALLRTVSIRPGQDLEETLVCPTGAAPALVTVHPELTGEPPPAELRDRIWYRFELVRRKFDADHWSRPHSGGDPGSLHEIVNWFVTPDGRMIALGPTSETQVRIEGIAEAAADGSEPLAPRPAGALGGITYARWTLPADVQPAETLAVEAGTYALAIASVCIADADDPSGRTLLQLLNPDGDQRSSLNSDFDPRTSIRVLDAISSAENSVSIPVRTKAITMARLAVDAFPGRKAAAFHYFGRSFPWGNLFGYFDGPIVGSKVAFFVKMGREPAGLVRRSNHQLEDAILRGIEVLSLRSFRPHGERPARDAYELLVLLSDSEVEVLRPYSNRVSFASDEPNAERTELSPDTIERFETVPPADVAMARNYFDALDSDKDGMVSPVEFESSKRLKPLFEAKGVSFDQPVGIEDFQRRYLEATRDQESPE